MATASKHAGNHADAVSADTVTDGTRYIVETKGLEDTNVAYKDRAAQLWCENTTRLAGKPWAYLKVLQTAYKQLQPNRFEDLFVLEQSKLL